MIEALFHVEHVVMKGRAMPGRPTDAERRCDAPAVELYLGPEGAAGVLRAVAHVDETPERAPSGEPLVSPEPVTVQHNADVLHLQCDRDRNHQHDHGALLLLRGNVDDRLYALDVTWREVHR